MSERLKTGFLSLLAITSGIFITVVDSNPSWDDAGITALMILGTTAFLGYFSPKLFWLWALLIAAWIPLYGIISTHNYESILALIIGFIGALGGALAHKMFSRV
jgi:hypothetical protein